LDKPWVLSAKDIDKRRIIKNRRVSGKVFNNYVDTFSYSGIDWGWMHIGFSLEHYFGD